MPDDYEPKNFDITSENEIEVILDLIGNFPVSRVPLIKSDDTDNGPNWIINIYFKNGDFRFIPVDKTQILGKTIKSSQLYEYLRKKYT